MKVSSISSANVYPVFGIVVLAYVLAGCDIDGGNNLPPVSDKGLAMYAEANLHETEDMAQIAAAVYSDGAPVTLIGGDIFEVRTGTQRVLLKDKGDYEGSYAASLALGVLYAAFDVSVEQSGVVFINSLNYNYDGLAAYLTLKY